MRNGNVRGMFSLYVCIPGESPKKLKVEVFSERLNASKNVFEQKLNEILIDMCCI